METPQVVNNPNTIETPKASAKYLFRQWQGQEELKKKLVREMDELQKRLVTTNELIGSFYDKMKHYVDKDSKETSTYFRDGETLFKVNNQSGYIYLLEYEDLTYDK